MFFLEVDWRLGGAKLALPKITRGASFCSTPALDLLFGASTKGRAFFWGGFYDFFFISGGFQ
jgi:hypothetical protein